MFTYHGKCPNGKALAIQVDHKHSFYRILGYACEDQCVFSKKEEMSLLDEAVTWHSEQTRIPS